MIDCCFLPRSCRIGFLAVVVCFGVISPSGALGQTVPWILPWNDATKGVVTDFSGLNTPIGKNWVQVDTNGHFVVDGQRVRYLGVNFAGDSPFMPTNNAEGVAGRLAKFGVNNVRFHHMDASWAYGGGLLAYTSTKSTNFNASQLDRLHYLVSRLKAHGISSDINLLVGREYRSQDGLGAEVTTMDWKDAHILGYFYQPALDLQKDYATKLLGPTNRYTGLPLAQRSGGGVCGDHQRERDHSEMAGWRAGPIAGEVCHEPAGAVEQLAGGEV